MHSTSRREPREPRRRLGLGIAPLLCALAACTTPEPADIVLRGGGIYTADAARTRAEALAIRDGEIVAVGRDADVSRFVGDGTRLVDLTGRLALPGFHDAHIHTLSSGHAMLGCPLQTAQSVESLLEALLACARESDEEWVVGDDFDLGLFPGGNPRKATLDAVLPDRPVLVLSSDGHTSWVNSRALERAGITAETPDLPRA